MDKKKIEHLIQEVNSGTTEAFTKALSEIKKTSKSDFIDPLLDRLSKEDAESEVFQLIHATMVEIKISEALPKFIARLETQKEAHIHQAILYFIWNSGLDASDQLGIITKVGLEGDYMTSFEALTVLENQDGPFQEETVLDALLACKTYLSKNEVDDQRKGIIEAIVKQLHAIEGTVQ